ncbi:unnamed protein product [Moneuplotes crassus]|uniref:AAA+ ATPase domain-containing protein n=1 Tax=Euplotes crassus TaxID=5936 RepID=A0AAD1U2Z4_EUPCR|nr:unnamed protein product [Moneuplotes crassus]
MFNQDLSLIENHIRPLVEKEDTSEYEKGLGDGFLSEVCDISSLQQLGLHLLDPLQKESLELNTEIKLNEEGILIACKKDNPTDHIRVNVKGLISGLKKLDSKIFDLLLSNLGYTKTQFAELNTQENQAVNCIKKVPSNKLKVGQEPPQTKINFDNLDLMGMDDILFGEIEEKEHTSQCSEEGKVAIPEQFSAPGIFKIKYIVQTSVRINLFEEEKGNEIDLHQFINEEDLNKCNQAEEYTQKLKKTKSSHQNNGLQSLDCDKNSHNFRHLKSNDESLKLMQENDMYREKLRLALRAIKIRDTQIHRLKSEGNVIPLDMTNSRLHLAFLFASPLIRKVEGGTDNVMLLDCQKEIRDIVDVCSAMDYEMKYKSVVATPSNMRSVLTDGPIALHFSGHGMENKEVGYKSRLGGEDKGDILLLENEKCMTEYFYERDLKKMIKLSQINLEVVFVSSCHSEFAGKVFLNAGAKHVICIKQSEEVDDGAALRFSKVFYETLFVKNYTVCASFHIAKEEVRKILKDNEANKFLLLMPQEKGHHLNSRSKHLCQAVTNIKPGGLINLGEKPTILSVPSKIDNFVGRQKEMYDIINHLSTNRLVSILGLSGIGKTSIARNLADYLKQRHKFRDGIIYVGLRGCESSQMFLANLSLIIRTEIQLENDYKKMKDSEVEDRALVHSFLRDKQILLILDNCEDPIDSDEVNFTKEIESILDECSESKFLLTSRTALELRSHHKEMQFPLESLSNEASVRCLFEKAPRKISPNEIKELFVATRFNSSRYPNKSLFLKNHPLFLLLGGHPQAISLAAPLLQYKSLTELFNDLSDSDVLNPNKPQNNKKTSDSLRNALELSISAIKSWNSQTIDLFMILGMFPGGIKQNYITKIWGDATWVVLKDELAKASLIVYKTNNRGEFIFSLLPFITIRACEFLNQKPQTKAELHEKSCQILEEFCREIFEEKRLFTVKKKLTEMEANIWACIYRGINVMQEVSKSSGNNERTKDPFITNRACPRSSISKILPQIESTNQEVEDITDSDLGSINSLDTQRLELLINHPNDYRAREELNNEEKIVLFYVNTLISISKESDALKMYKLYKKKEEISTLCLANLYKSVAYIYSSKGSPQDTERALKISTKCIKLFESLNKAKGVVDLKFFIAYKLGMVEEETKDFIKGSPEARQRLFTQILAFYQENDFPQEALFCNKILTSLSPQGISPSKLPKMDPKLYLRLTS